jgi:hypothetical protein
MLDFSSPIITLQRRENETWSSGFVEKAPQTTAAPAFEVSSAHLLMLYLS